MAQEVKQYVDLQGLQEFYDKLKLYYAAETTDSRVGYAKTAGAAATANALAAARTISLTGDVTGSVSTTLGSDASIAVTAKDATQTTHGFMSAADKVKLDALQKINSIITGAGTDMPGGLKFENNTLSLDLTSYATKTDISSVFRYIGTVANVAALSTLSAAWTDDTTKNSHVGDVYHIEENHTEYVYAKGSTTDTAAGHDTYHWEELGLSVDLTPYLTKADAETTYRKKADKINVSEINDTTAGSEKGLTDFIKAVEVNKAKEASKVTNALSIKLSDENTKTYDGSAAVSVDLSNIATEDTVAKKVDKLATFTTGNILSASSEGGLADTGVASTILKGGAVTDSNTSFVTGKQVYDAILAQDKNHQDTTYTFESSTDGNFKVTPIVNKDGKTTTGTTQTINTGADKNVLEKVLVKNAGETSATELKIDAAKGVTVDLTSYALYANIQSVPVASIDAMFS